MNVIVCTNQAMRASLTLKTVAARYYINGNYSLAAKQYTEALHVLYDVDPQHEEQVCINDVQNYLSPCYYDCAFFTPFLLFW